METDADTTLLSLRERIRAFVSEREWDSFHNPKDLSMAISAEAAELMELFLWKTAHQIDDELNDERAGKRVREELADIVILCLSLAERLQIDVTGAVLSKVASNEVKYPVHKARGSARKYTEY
jgi:NTP pyrophosphatase (non-canonical NTP hydrolase)